MTRVMPLKARPTIKMAVLPGAAAATASAEAAAESAEEGAASAAAALASETAAAASAAAALVSENNAETAEGNAETAAATATTQAVIATTQAGLAATAKTAAELAETNAETAETNAEAAQVAAETARDLAQNYAAALSGTSVTSLTVGTGSKAFTTQSAKQWISGQRLRAASDDGTLVMEGEVSSYTGTTLTINVDFTEGAGTHADWNIGIAGARGATGAAGSMTGPVSSVDGNIATFDGITGTVVEDSGVPIANVYRSGGTDVPVVDGGTGSSTAGGAATNLGLGTGDSPQFTAVNIGHASDTTLARSGAGELTVEGNRIFRVGGADVPIADGGTAASTASAAFDNLKQAATTSATGVVEKATDAEVRAATADKYISADLIESASAGVALTDAATVAVDWDAGIFFTLTITANRILGNPTNGQPGTFRIVHVQANTTTDRTLTFGNQYLNVLPVLTDIDSAQEYLLTIFCLTTTHFIVTATKATNF